MKERPALLLSLLLLLLHHFYTTTAKPPPRHTKPNHTSRRSSPPPPASPFTPLQFTAAPSSLRVAALVIGQKRIYDGVWPSHHRFLFRPILSHASTAVLDVFLCFKRGDTAIPLGMMPAPATVFFVESDVNQAGSLSQCFGALLGWIERPMIDASTNATTIPTTNPTTNATLRDPTNASTTATIDDRNASASHCVPTIINKAAAAATTPNNDSTPGTSPIACRSAILPSMQQQQPAAPGNGNGNGNAQARERLRVVLTASQRHYDYYLRVRTDAELSYPMAWPPPPPGSPLSADVFAPLKNGFEGLRDSLGSLAPYPWFRTSLLSVNALSKYFRAQVLSAAKPGGEQQQQQQQQQRQSSLQQSPPKQLHPSSLARRGAVRKKQKMRGSTGRGRVRAGDRAEKTRRRCADATDQLAVVRASYAPAYFGFPDDLYPIHGIEMPQNGPHGDSSPTADFRRSGGLLNESCMVSDDVASSREYIYFECASRLLFLSFSQYQKAGTAPGNVVMEGVLNYRLRRTGATISPWDFGGFVLPAMRKGTVRCASCENASLTACLPPGRQQQMKMKKKGIYSAGEDPRSKRKTRGVLVSDWVGGVGDGG